MGRKKIIAAALLVGMAAASLPMGSWWLSYNDTLPSPRPQQAIVIDGGAEVMRAAAEFAAADPNRRLILYSPRLTRSQRLGATRSRPQRSREDLIVRGVAPEQFVVHRTDAANEHRWFQAIDDDVRGDTLVLVDAMHGRTFRHVIDQSLTPRQARRYRVVSVSSPLFRPSTWFRTRHGGKVLAIAWLRYAFVLMVGQGDDQIDDRYDSLMSPAEPVAAGGNAT